MEFDGPVHLSDWAQQPDVRIKCTQAYTTPAWGKASSVVLPNDANGEGGVYRAATGDLYTFTVARVTCEKCR